MENDQPVEVNTTPKGVIYLPETAKGLKFLSEIKIETLFYTPGQEPVENLNYKFLLPALEKIKGEDYDYVIGFDHDLSRTIIGYPNPEGRFLVFNAHQQAAIFTHIFLAGNSFPSHDEEKTRLVIKGVVLSQQIDKIVTKNNGAYKESHAGYEDLKERILGVDDGIEAYLAFDERNHVIFDLEKEKNVALQISMIDELVRELKGKEKTLYDFHVDLQIRYKLYGEKTFNITSEGENKKIFDRFRTKPPSDAMHEELVSISDYKKQTFFNKLTGRKSEPELRQMDMVQLDYSSGLKITVELLDEGTKLFLHLSDYTDCYNKDSFPTSRKGINDRLLKTVVSLGKMVIDVN
jgi:phosphoglucomutase